MQGVNAANGKRLGDSSHLRQSVFDILTTPIGSRVLVRDYGSRLFDLVDNPQDESTRVHIIAATAGALARWEPRLQVKAVTVQFVSEGEFDLTIDGISSETGYPITLEELTINGDQFRNN
ncbi:GPW/gp25 family protein [Serratia ficaria]|uniref:GPW/gp25 family protein n=1 Tax=Serratia ficaria TaxID=61651 RepID=UPI00218321FB|nr:GPW/gp25 family protein [Serratia ficaria]CAI2527501.1 Gene 25-like lysozyme [Serratia ficaria]